MIYKEKIITLKNGQFCTLRSAIEDDAENFIGYLKQIYGETEYMTRYDDELAISVDDEKKIISTIVDNPKDLMLSAFLGDRLIANANISGISPFDKLRHRAGLGISVIKEFWNIGIGSVLLSEIIDEATAVGYAQIELEVVAENERAIALYKKYGFEVYGTRERSFKFRDGSYHAEHLMLRKV